MFTVLNKYQDNNKSSLTLISLKISFGYELKGDFLKISVMQVQLGTED